MQKEEQDSNFEEEVEALAAGWPRALIAAEMALDLAHWWVKSRRRAISTGKPPFAHHMMTPSIKNGLFETRRARRLIRGLEGAQSSLASQEAGLRKTAASSATPSASVRVSRLLLVSTDGSERFFHQVEKLRRQFASRLEVLCLDCGEEALGEAAFGPGKKARALLIDHKDAVIRFLMLLEDGDRGASSDNSI